MSGSKDDGVDDPISFFKSTSASAIARVLARADRNAAKEARRQQNLIRSALRPHRTLLGKALGKALAHHGRASRGRASIRQTAPDTGGRPYHFGYSSVTKGESARGGKRNGGVGRAASGDEGGAPSGGGTARKGRSAGSTAAGATINGKPRSREAAHQNYAERHAALEKNPVEIQQAIREGDAERRLEQEGRGAEAGSDRDGPAQDGDRPSPDLETSRSLTMIEPAGREQGGPEMAADRERPRRGLDPALSQEWVEREIGRGPGLSERHSEAAAQAYIENPDKSAQLRGTTASFGTIGETFEERLEFWDLVHKHESKDGRTQSRLVVELPHEASAKARNEIVRRFTEDLLEKGIPFWASIHAPTRQNDYRNHHAHIVFIDRPASRMVHPETGELAWDFTVAVKIKKASRNTILSYPYRQNRDPDMRDRGYIKRSRARFSEVTNEVMRTHGVGVRYDPRSYKDMGLDVAPMNHVSRILADKTKSQAFVVMDPEWTRKMINQEMKAAAIRRDETYQALRATEDRLQAVTKTLQDTTGANKVLPKDMQLSPGHRLTRDVGNKLVRKWTEIERDRLAAKFVDEVTIRTLNHIVEATTPKTTAKGPAKVHSGGQAPDAEDLRHLNEAARAELRAYKLQASSRSNWYGNRREEVGGEWRDESEGTAHRSKAARTPPAAPEVERNEPGHGPATGTTRKQPPGSTGERPPPRGMPEAEAERPSRAQTRRTASQSAASRDPRTAAPDVQAQERAPHAMASRRAQAPRQAGEADQIADGLKHARRMAQERVQRMILTAGSPTEFAEMIDRQNAGNSAAALFDAHMARARAKAREPMVTIVSQDMVRPAVDPTREVEIRRQAAAAKPEKAAARTAERPAPARDRPHPPRLGSAPAPATQAARETNTPAVHQASPQKARSDKLVAARVSTPTPPPTVAAGARTANRNLLASEIEEQPDQFGGSLPANARRQRLSTTTATEPTTAGANTNGSVMGRASRPAETTRTQENEPPRKPAARPLAGAPRRKLTPTQPELFSKEAVLSAADETTAVQAETDTIKNVVPPTTEEIKVEKERKKRRRALLAEKQRNRGGFEI